MKTLHTALLASSFMLVTYVATPAPAHAGGWYCAQVGGDPTRAEKKTNADTDVALDRARHGLPVRTEVEALQESVGVEDLTYVGLPDQCVIQMMLTQELADLHARAANFLAHELEVRQTQFQIVLARYERAVLKINEAWKHGEMAEDIAYQTLATMRVDAFDFLQSLGVTSIRERLQEAMAELIARGTDAMDRLDAVHDTFERLYELRLETSVAVFESRFSDGKVTKLDFLRVDAAVRGLETLQLTPLPNDCGS